MVRLHLELVTGLPRQRTGPQSVTDSPSATWCPSPPSTNFVARIIESNPVAALYSAIGAAHVFQDTAVAYDAARRAGVAIVTGEKDPVQAERRRLLQNRSQRPRGQSSSSGRRSNAVADTACAASTRKAGTGCGNGAAGHDPARAALRRRSEQQVPAARADLRAGPDRIAAATGVPARTITRILRRHGIPAPAACDPVTGTPIRAHRQSANRYEPPAPGDMIHLDVKKLGRIPEGGGHRAHGRERAARGRGIGYDYLHTPTWRAALPPVLGGGGAFHHACSPIRRSWPTSPLPPRAKATARHPARIRIGSAPRLDMLHRLLRMLARPSTSWPFFPVAATGSPTAAPRSSAPAPTAWPPPH